MAEISDFFIQLWDWVKYNILSIIFILVSLTFLQKYHFRMLFYIMRTKWIFSKFIVFINRIWIIVHEFSHLIFVLFSWAKINNITLFSKTWWNVSFEHADYIWSLPYNSWGIWSVFVLILNKFMIFLSALWPLILWMILNAVLMKYVFWISYFWYWIWIWNLTHSFVSWFVLILYSIFFMPYFILSYKDMQCFVYYNGTNFLAKIIWSFINIIVFWLLLFLLSYFYNYFLSFFIIYILSFLITWIIYIFVKLIRKYSLI